MNHVTRFQAIGLSIVSVILFIDTFLYGIIVPIIPNFIDRFQISSQMVGLLFSAYAVGLLIATPFMGKISDRVGRKKPLLFGLIALIVTTISFAHVTSASLLIFSRFLQGIAAGTTSTVALALVADLFPTHRRGQAMGIALTSMSLGTLLGAPIGGWLFEHMNVIPFYFSALLTVGALILVWSVIQDLHLPTKSETKKIVLVKNQNLYLILTIVLVAECSLTFLEPVLPIYFTDELQVTPTTIGLLFGVASLAYAFSAPLAGKFADQYNPYWIIVIGMSGLVLSLPLLFLFKSLFAVTLFMQIIGISLGFALTPTLPLVGKIYDQHQKNSNGVAYSLFNLLHGAGMAVGPLVADFC